MSEFVITGRNASGQPVYEEVLNQQEIIERLKSTDEWGEFSNRFDASTESNSKLLGMLFVEKLGDDPGVEDYQRLLKNIIRSGGVVRLSTIKDSAGNVLLEAGQYEFDLRPAEPEPQPELEVPRDKNGQPLSQSQIAWGEMARWSNQASSQEIKGRRRTDPAFANFYRLNIEREASETPSTQFQLAGLPAGQATASDKLQRFAKLYQELPTDRLKPRGGYITLSDEFKLTKSQFDNFVSHASSAGLL